MAKGRQGWNLRKGQHRPWVLRGERNPGWKGDAARDESKRARAQRAYELTKCEECDKPATDRHHKDGNPGNNDPSNIARLCRRCHMVADGRLDRFLASSASIRGPQPPKICANCRRLSKPMRRGRCHTCNEYLRRHGVERPYLGDGRVEKSIPARGLPCLRCGRPRGCVGGPIRGFCRSCYTFLQRKKELPEQSLL